MSKLFSETREEFARREFATAISLDPPDWESARCALASIAFEHRLRRKARRSKLLSIGQAR